MLPSRSTRIGRKKKKRRRPNKTRRRKRTRRSKPPPLLLLLQARRPRAVLREVRRVHRKALRKGLLRALQRAQGATAKLLRSKLLSLASPLHSTKQRGPTVKRRKVTATYARSRATMRTIPTANFALPCAGNAVSSLIIRIIRIKFGVRQKTERPRLDRGSLTARNRRPLRRRGDLGAFSVSRSASRESYARTREHLEVMVL